MRPLDIQAIYTATRSKGRSGTTHLHAHRSRDVTIRARSNRARGMTLTGEVHDREPTHAYALLSTNSGDRSSPPGAAKELAVREAKGRVYLASGTKAFLRPPARRATESAGLSRRIQGPRSDRLRRSTLNDPADWKLVEASGKREE